MVESAPLVRRRGDARRARGRHRGHPRRPGAGARRVGRVARADRERELDGEQPDHPGAQHRRGLDRHRRAATCRARSPSTAKGEILELKNTINTMVDQLSAFASEVTRVAREVGTEGVLGGQAQVAGASGVWRELTENVNSMANNLTEPGAQHRRGDHRDRRGRPGAQDHRRRARRDPHAQEHHQRHGRQAEPLRRRGDARGAPGRHRGHARRAGRRARTCRASGRS